MYKKNDNKANKRTYRKTYRQQNIQTVNHTERKNQRNKSAIQNKSAMQKTRD